MNATALKILRAAVAAIMLLALGMSFHHIADLFGAMDAGWERWVAPVLIDFVAILGKIGTGSQFNARTRRTGKNTMIIAGSFSLAANIATGTPLASEGWAVGSMLIGAGVVVVALWAENYLHGMALKATRPAKTAAPASQATPAAPVNLDGRTQEVSAEQREKWAAAGRKAAATRKANLAAKAELAALSAPEMPEDTRAYL